MRHLPAVNGDSPSIVLQRTDIVGPSVAKKLEQKERRQAKRMQAEQAAQETLRAAGITPSPKAVNGAKKTVSKRPAKKAPVKKASARV
jgi:hypothetical protein